MGRLLKIFTDAFPLWVLGAGVLAFYRPEWLLGFKPYIVYALAVVMLGMGITLSIEDFYRVFQMPGKILAGYIAQYSIMPFLGWLIAHGLNLPSPFAVGLILVACCPGGTASNVVTYLARGDVALSVLMTSCSTLGAVIMTPFLTQWLAGTFIQVDAWGLFADTLKVVFFPVLAGLALNHFFSKATQRALPVAPLISVVLIAMICGSVIAVNRESILVSGGKMLLGVFLLHSGGFFLGYFFSWMLRYDRITHRTISIEVGMQNSGLGVVLASQNFPQSPLTPVPCAVSSVFHSVIGSLLAAVWRLKSRKNPQK